MSQQASDGSTEPPPLPAIRKFLEIYQKAKAAPGQYKTLVELFGNEKEGYTTTLGQLARIAAFITGEKTRSGNVDVLFYKPTDTSSLTPTAAAHETYRYFNALPNFYESARTAIRAKGGFGEATLPLVTIGTPQTIGLWLLSRIFSDWKRLFDKQLRLELLVGNVSNLIPKIDLGKMHFIVAFGAQKPEGKEDNTKIFPLGCECNQILICHPKAELYIGGVDVNKDYWNKEYPGKTSSATKRRTDPVGCAMRPLPYEQLREVDFAKVDPETTQFIDVNTMYQPKRLTEVLNDWKDITGDEGIRRVDWNDEAISLVQMGYGIAVVPEFFCDTPSVTAFRLMPAEDYRRSIVAYYSENSGPLGNAARFLLEFIRRYLKEFASAVRRNQAPSLGHPGFDKLCSDWCKEFDPVGGLQKFANTDASKPLP